MVAIAALRDELAGTPSVQVTLCCYSEAMRSIFQRALDTG